MSAPKKPKFQYKHKAGAAKRSAIVPNLKGFLCSCNYQERECVREAYNILNKHADILYPAPQAVENAETNEADELEIEDALNKEISSLQTDKSTPRRFQVMESGAKNFLFISTTLENPLELAQHIVEDIYEHKQQQTRFLLRLIPVETTCKAYLDDMRKAFQLLAEKHFASEPKTFCVVYNHRNNDNLKREEVLKTFAEIVFSVKSEHKVDLKAAEVSVVVEVVRSFAFIGVIPNYIKYKKYNLVALSEQKEEETKIADATEDEQQTA